MNRTELFEQIGAATEDDALKILSLLFYKNIPTTADLEPDDIPSWQNILDATAGSGNTSYQIAFATSHTFHWQTDLIDGVNTYAAILGNNPPKYSFWNIADDGTLTPAVPQMTITLASGLIDTIVIDMGAGNWTITF